MQTSRFPEFPYGHDTIGRGMLSVIVADMPAPRYDYTSLPTDSPDAQTLVVEPVDLFNIRSQIDRIAVVHVHLAA